MAYIANKGWYYTPHLVDSIEGGDKFDLLSKFKVKHRVFDIPDSVFEAVHDGMQMVVERGTGINAKVPGINICGKTGTVENYIGTVKQPNHAFFCGFAPRENPRIAIMCVGGKFRPLRRYVCRTYRGVDDRKYLNDSIAGKERQAKVEKMQNLNRDPATYLSGHAPPGFTHACQGFPYPDRKGYIKIVRIPSALKRKMILKHWINWKKIRIKSPYPLAIVWPIKRMPCYPKKTGSLPVRDSINYWKYRLIKYYVPE